MCIRFPGRMLLVFGALFVAAFSVWAAPAPPPAAAPIDKYLLDDTDYLLLVEVKPLLASPLARQYSKQIEELLKSDPVQVWLKDAGFDPLRDVERILVVMSRRCYSKDPEDHQDGPVVLVQGRFDAAKLKAKMEQLAKDSPQGVKVEAQEEIYRLTIPRERAPYFLTQLDRNTLMLAHKKELIAETRKKAADKKKTSITSPAIREFLKQRKPEPAVQVVLDARTIWETAWSSSVINGVRQTKVRHTTLEDMGILRIGGGLSAGEKIRGNLLLKTRDADTAKQTAEALRMGIKQVGDELGAKVKAIAQNRGENLERANKRDLAPLRKAVGDTSVEAEGTAITLTTEIDREAVEAFLRIFFGVGR